jgi:hypothetical protein
MSGVFLEAFVDPGGRPGPLFFGCTVCQPRAGAGAEVEAEATGARAGPGVEAGVEVEVGAGAGADTVVGAGRGCVVRSWKWVGRSLYASFAASFLFFLSGHSGDQDMCLPAQGIHRNLIILFIKKKKFIINFLFICFDFSLSRSVLNSSNALCLELGLYASLPKHISPTQRGDYGGYSWTGWNGLRRVWRRRTRMNLSLLEAS